MEENSCTMRGMEYENGSEVCELNRCFRCNEGSWEIIESSGEDEDFLV